MEIPRGRTVVTKRTYPARRLEALVDGVTAIAITLLVIELAVPIVRSSEGKEALVNALVDLWPSFLAYLIGFFAVGVWWLQHHALFDSLDHVNGRFIVLTFLFLLGIGFIPFTTGLLAEYMGAEDQNAIGVFVFSVWQMYTAIVFNVAAAYAIHNQLGGSIKRKDDTHRFNIHLWSTPVLWAVIASIGLTLPALAITLILAVTAMWLIWVPQLQFPTQHQSPRST